MLPHQLGKKQLKKCLNFKSFCDDKSEIHKARQSSVGHHTGTLQVSHSMVGDYIPLLYVYKKGQTSASYLCKIDKHSRASQKQN